LHSFICGRPAQVYAEYALMNFVVGYRAFAWFTTPGKELSFYQTRMASLIPFGHSLVFSTPVHQETDLISRRSSLMSTASELSHQAAAIKRDSNAQPLYSQFPSALHVGGKHS
jgi:hypothetical protein